MIANFPFQPSGGPNSTRSVPVTAVSTQMPLPPIGSDGGTLLLTVVGTQPVFVSYGDSTALVATSMPLLANSAQTISVPGGLAWLSVIANATGSTLYATAGWGS